MTEIIPINEDMQEKAIQALVTLKKSESLASLAANPAAVDQKLAEYYRQASEAGIILRINAVIRALGQESPKGVYEWSSANGRDLRCRFNSLTGTTAVAVGERIVLSNERADMLILLPGDWLNYLNDCYRTRNQEQAWAAEIEAQRANERKVSDFLADV